MKFVQLIEFKSGDIDAFNRTLDESLAKTGGVRTATRPSKAEIATMTKHTFTSSKFPSYESAMENSNRPETAEFAASRPSSVTALRLSAIWT